VIEDSCEEKRRATAVDEGQSVGERSIESEYISREVRDSSRLVASCLTLLLWGRGKYR
jgi:hypothetical protein